MAMADGDVGVSCGDHDDSSDFYCAFARPSPRGAGPRGRAEIQLVALCDRRHGRCENSEPRSRRSRIICDSECRNCTVANQKKKKKKICALSEIRTPVSSATTRGTNQCTQWHTMHTTNYTNKACSNHRPASIKLIGESR